MSRQVKNGEVDDGMKVIKEVITPMSIGFLFFGPNNKSENEWLLDKG